MILNWWVGYSYLSLVAIQMFSEMTKMAERHGQERFCYRNIETCTQRRSCVLQQNGDHLPCAHRSLYPILIQYNDPDQLWTSMYTDATRMCFLNHSRHPHIVPYQAS